MKTVLRALLSIVLLANAAVASPGNFWSERRSASNQPKSAKVSLLKPTVYVLKDIHSHRETQDDLQRRLNKICGALRIDFVALEGAFGPQDLAGFRNFPYPRSV